MEKFIIATGKTIDQAVANALEELGLERDSVSVEVLESPKSGFLGLGGHPAKVKVSYEAPDEPAAPAAPAAPAPAVPEAPKSALSSASRKPKKSNLPKKQEPEIPESGAVLRPKNPTPPAPAPRAPKPPRAPQEQRAPRAPREQRAPQEQRPVMPPKEYPVAAPGSTEEKIEGFLKGLLEHMGSNAVPHAVAGDADTYQVELVGEHLGMLIGRRGETLDAIQHLTNYAMNHGAQKHIRVNVDAECYRQKREESLQRLALKVAGKVERYRRNVTLEPMNAYERHVIHAILQDQPNVSTYSIGTEPNRRVVVAYGKNAAPRQ